MAGSLRMRAGRRRLAAVAVAGFVLLFPGAVSAPSQAASGTQAPPFMTAGERTSATTAPPAAPAVETLPASSRSPRSSPASLIPTAVQFANDGRIFVAEKSGLIKVFDSLTDHDADDLRRSPHRHAQLLGPRAPRPRAAPELPGGAVRLRPLHVRPHAGRTVPTWGAPGATVDSCPDPPGDTDNGCVVTGRVSRLTAIGRHDGAGREQVLHRELVPAVPEPLDRRRSRSAATARST